MSSADMDAAATPPAGATPPNTGTETAEKRSTNNLQGANSTRNRGHTKSGNTSFSIGNFKGEVSKVGAVIRTKSEHRTKDPIRLFQEKIVSYVMQEYKKGRDIVPLIKKIEDIDTTKWKPTHQRQPQEQQY